MKKLRQFEEKYSKSYATMENAEKAMAKLEGDFTWIPSVGHKGRIIPVILMSSLESPNYMHYFINNGHPCMG